MAFPLIVPALAAGGMGLFLTNMLRWFFMAHLAAFVLRAFAVLGLAWFTNEMIVTNVLDLIHSRMSGIPGYMAEWMDALEIDKVISITASAYLLLSVKRLFLGRSA
jgi:hypothetical protein